MGLGQDRIRNPGSAVRLTSVARHVTDCATRPGNFFFNKGFVSNNSVKLLELD